MNTTIRTSFAIAAATVLFAAMPTWADTNAVRDGNAPPSKDQTKLVRMITAAKNAPDPALKHHLLPTLIEQKPGNPILMYYLAQQMLPDRSDPNVAEGLRQRAARYLEVPLDKLPVKEVKEFLDNHYQNVLRQVQTGATRKDPDWGLELGNGPAMILPNLTDFRRIAQILAIRARMEIAQGQFDQAKETIKVGMALGKHVAGGCPVLITALVAIAIETTMLDRVAELIERGGPNLYWALAELPDPLIDIRLAIQWESQWLVMYVPELRKAQGGALSQAEAEALLKSMVDIQSAATGQAKSALTGPKELAAQAALVTQYYEPGREALIKRGRSPQQVQAMPAGQVVALYLLEDYFHWRDELFKCFALPYWQARPVIQSSEREFTEWAARQGPFNPLTGLLPAVGRAYLVNAQLDRTRAALQTVESIRAFAARRGRTPKTLDELDLPVPIDPVLGKPFQYEPGDQCFTLVAPAPEGEPARFALRCEIKLAIPAKPATAPTTAPAPAQPDQSVKGTK